MEPAHLIVLALGIMFGMPLVGAIMAFLPDPAVASIGRALLVAGWLSCLAAILGCIWLSLGESSGIGNDIFLLVAVIPAVGAFVWFVTWRVARRLAYLRSLPPEREN